MQTMLPPIYESAEAVGEWRRRLIDNLAHMRQDGVQLDPSKEIFPTLFYLAYQGQNDRPIAEALAALATPGANWLERPVRKTSGKIRIGFLSKYLRDHTIGRLNAGLIAGLDRAAFDVTVLAIGGTDDRLGARIRQSADRFFALPPDLPSAAQRIADEQFDILYFPEIGMDPLTYTLAHRRFAPVQCATWGHPVTSGLKTIDYFLSSRDLETANSADYWTEKVVRLPRVGVCYERPQVSGTAPERGEFGLPSAGHLYVCPQTLFKFHPDFDIALREILDRDPQGWLVLLEGNHRRWTELLQARFARSLGAAAERVRFLPGQPHAAYLRLLQLADCLLDPLHFGGGNSSYECFALGAPVVTRPSEFLRGRLTYAMYRQMEMDDLIAVDEADYVHMAVRLGTDADFRTAMRGKILERCSELFADASAIRSIEDFFRQAVESAHSADKCS
jgi:predicted O-linked N-acetylglucosamine transferase (SPINDLY family)